MPDKTREKSCLLGRQKPNYNGFTPLKTRAKDYLLLCLLSFVFYLPKTRQRHARLHVFYLPKTRQRHARLHVFYLVKTRQRHARLCQIRMGRQCLAFLSFLCFTRFRRQDKRGVTLNPQAVIPPFYCSFILMLT